MDRIFRSRWSSGLGVLGLVLEEAEALAGEGPDLEEDGWRSSGLEEALCSCVESPTAQRQWWEGEGRARTTSALLPPAARREKRRGKEKVRRRTRG